MKKNVIMLLLQSQHYCVIVLLSVVLEVLLLAGKYTVTTCMEHMVLLCSATLISSGGSSADSLSQVSAQQKEFDVCHWTDGAELLLASEKMRVSDSLGSSWDKRSLFFWFTVQIQRGMRRQTGSTSLKTQGEEEQSEWVSEGGRRLFHFKLKGESSSSPSSPSAYRPQQSYFAVLLHGSCLSFSNVMRNLSEVPAGCGLLPGQRVEEHQLSQVREGEARVREMEGWWKEPTQRKSEFPNHTFLKISSKAFNRKSKRQFLKWLNSSYFERLRLRSSQLRDAVLLKYILIKRNSVSGHFVLFACNTTDEKKQRWRTGSEKVSVGSTGLWFACQTLASLRVWSCWSTRIGSRKQQRRRWWWTAMIRCRVLLTVQWQQEMSVHNKQVLMGRYLCTVATR